MRLISLLVFISLTCFSQAGDSLLYQIKQIENDTERVNQLYEEGFKIRNVNPELSYQFAITCEQEALKSHSKKHLAKSYNLSGVLFYKKSNYTKALQFQKQALALNQSIDNEPGIAINQTNLGNIYSDINHYKLAESFYLQALKSYNKMNHTLQMTRCLINIGVLKHTQKQAHAAIKQFKEALTFANKLGDYDLMASCYNNIGAILTEQNNLDSALLYLEEGLKLRYMVDNKVELADSYLNLADLYLKQRNFDQVNHYLLSTDEICRTYDYPEAQLELYHTHAALYEMQKNYEQATIYLKKYISLKDSLQKMEKENTDVLPLEEQGLPSHFEESNHLHNLWLIVLTGFMMVAIPLYLIRYKR